jgi:hypothetical protein
LVGVSKSLRRLCFQRIKDFFPLLLGEKFFGSAEPLVGEGGDAFIKIAFLQPECMDAGQSRK